MFKLCSLFNKNVHNVFQHAPESPTTSYIHTFTKSFRTKKTHGFKVLQIRCQNIITPPRVTPRKPSPIPYVRPDLKPSKGGLLLLIPAISFGLGTWQMYRLKWKTDLIKTIEEKSAMDPVPLPADPEEVAEMKLRKVIVKGTFDHENEFLYGPKPCVVGGDYNTNVVSTTGEGSFGYNLVTPFVLADTGERILVNRGWIRTKTTKPEKRPWSKTEGEQTIIGVVREPEKVGFIGPAKQKKYNVWHYRDIADMAEKKKCLPIFIDAVAEHSIPKLLWAGQTRVKLRNEHLSYIVTWYALTIATSYLWYSKYVKIVA